MHSTSQSVAPATAADGAVLVVAHDGRIQLASAAAAALWQARPDELAGDFFPNLFVFEVTSQEPGWVQSQWEVLVAAAASRPIALRLQPKEASDFESLVRIEPAAGNPPQHLVFVARPASGAGTTPVATVTAIAPVAAPAEHFLGLLNDRGPLGFFDLNFLRNEAYYSPTWKKLLGYADDAMPNTYEAWLALIHPDDSAAAPDRQGRVATGTRPFSHEFRMKHALGHYVWLQCVGVQVYGPNGALQRVIGANLEIGDRKEFEELGLRAEERMREFGGAGRAGLFDLDFSAGLYWLSPGFKTFLGYSAAELPDTLESVLRSLPMDETTGGAQAYFLSRHPGQIAYFDVIHLRHREGRDVPVQACVIRQISRKKELQRVLGYVMPLAEGLAPTPEEAFSAPPLAALLAELHEGVLVADAGGNVLHLNPKAEKLLGRTLAQCLGQEAGEVFRLVHLQSGQPGENPVAKVLATAEPTALNTEFALEAGDAAPQPVAFSARAVPDATGRPAGAVVVFRLPSEMSLTPEELVRANRFEALGQLAGGIAHDFNNLLTTILGGVSLAKENRDYSGLENSERACLAAKGLSKQLLTFSRGGSGVRQVVRPADILADTVRLAAAGSTVKVEVEVAPDTGTICVDRAQMLQVFQNLVINAIQAMPTGQGRIWIKAANVTLAPAEVSGLVGGTYVTVEVRDNGSGIKPEHLEKIFAPFFTTKKNGTGLGLATVLSIVKRHGGQMGVESELGVGSAFTVFLPVAEQPAEVEARRAPTFNVATKTGRVLFMDDDPQICALTGGMLEGLGYKFDIAKTGEEAVQFYKRYLNIGRPYDVVIMDLTIIGGMGGEQTFRMLRDLHPEVRAIIASGYDNDDMARQFLDMGFLGYLTKPYRVGDLGRVLKKVLGS
ncbi:response regulator [Oleiharenicola lentus]|uniref:histidine kinase n=1 Tax=Oleiharenicola lentus TaxID=2508720 RepID=A0A4Q1CAE4_9BACT|nr:ATP-binding protein [Oleiharenicola lentus]RXK56053.1 response regulator [Oleiharenicola lentus]